jgi:glutamate synthase domain-containing protein 3
MTAPTSFDGRVVGHTRTPPAVVRGGDTATIDCRGTYYTYVNDAVRQAFAEGVQTVRLENVNGQRYIGTGLSGEDRRIEVHGTPGQALGMFMDGPTIEVFGNAQDGVGNTMNGGRIVVHGSAGDVLGYGMRCGHVYIRGDVGYRVGIHMKAYKDLRPVLVCGGKARDFFGEYMAGGLLVLLGMDSRLEGPVVGGHLATGMHGGEIYVRGEIEATRCADDVAVFPATADEMEGLGGVLTDYCAAVGMDLDEVLAVPFSRVRPSSLRPYSELYTSL